MEEAIPRAGFFLGVDGGGTKTAFVLTDGEGRELARHEGGSSYHIQVGFEALHASFIDRLVPVCATLLEAAAAAGEVRSDIDAYQLMRGVGNLCIGAEDNPGYDARRLVELLVAGLRRPR